MKSVCLTHESLELCCFSPIFSHSMPFKEYVSRQISQSSQIFQSFSIYPFMDDFKLKNIYFQPFYPPSHPGFPRLPQASPGVLSHPDDVGHRHVRVNDTNVGRSALLGPSGLGIDQDVVLGGLENPMVRIQRWFQKVISSVAMTQEPIDWRYLPYIRPI